MHKRSCNADVSSWSVTCFCQINRFILGPLVLTLLSPAYRAITVMPTFSRNENLFNLVVEDVAMSDCS